MALPDTNTMDIPNRGAAAEYTYSLISGPTVDTGTMDYPSRGAAATYIYVTTSAPAAATVVPGKMLMGMGF